jgi:signal transduction histidine kinase
MLRIRLKTKLVLAISGMVVALVALFSYLYVSHLVRQRTSEAYDGATFVAKQIRESAREASQQVDLSSTFAQGSDPKEIQAVLINALQNDSGLNVLLQSIVGYSQTIYDAAIADVNNKAIVHTDPTAIGHQLEKREDFAYVANGNVLQQLRVVFGHPKVYDVKLGIQREGRPFGEIRVGISTVFLKSEVQPQLSQTIKLSIAAILISLALAASVSNIALSPLEAIGRRLDQVTAGVPDIPPGPDSRITDEFGVNTKIDRLGRQIRDVKEVFSALKENLDQIMGALQDGLVLFTRDTRVVLVSASAERFIGRPRGEILGSMVEGVFSDANKLGRIVLDAFALQRPIPQREIELENGRRIQITLDFIAERGAQIGALLTMRDAESVRRLENEIELSQRLASIGRLTSGVAHEVKNPINAIVVHLEVLREKMRAIDPDTRRHLDIIGREIHRLDRVVQTLVDFNRPVDLRLSDFDLRRLAEDVVALASPDAARQGVDIRSNFTREPLLVRADSDLIKQAMLNVVLNGVQAMSQGGTLSVAARRNDFAALIEVRDQGCGIAPEIRDKIFNLYFTTKRAGSGIGLAMTYRVMQLHNGTLDFVTEMGRGTTFRLALPLTAAQERENQEAVART